LDFSKLIKLEIEINNTSASNNWKKKDGNVLQQLRNNPFSSYRN
jgi:hypothetical protein